MLDDAVALEDLIERAQRGSAIHHEVFGNYFEPINDRLLLEDVAVMRNAQADADTVLRVAVEAIGRHKVVKESRARIRIEKGGPAV